VVQLDDELAAVPAVVITVFPNKAAVYDSEQRQVAATLKQFIKAEG
jgi:hypothetical protein